MADHMRECCLIVVLILSAEIMQVWCFHETRPTQVKLQLMKDYHDKLNITYSVIISNF